MDAFQVPAKVDMKVKVATKVIVNSYEVDINMKVKVKIKLKVKVKLGKVEGDANLIKCSPGNDETKSSKGTTGYVNGCHDQHLKMKSLFCSQLFAKIHLVIVIVLNMHG